MATSANLIYFLQRKYFILLYIHAYIDLFLLENQYYYYLTLNIFVRAPELKFCQSLLENKFTFIFKVKFRIIDSSTSTELRKSLLWEWLKTSRLESLECFVYRSIIVNCL